MKLIRLADRENWDAVNEYLSDDLASDSADERDISKAIKSACSKAEKKERKRNGKPVVTRQVHILMQREGVASL